MVVVENELLKDRFIAFGDIHIHNYKDAKFSNDRLDHCLTCLQAVFHHAHIQKCKYILFTGDLFDSAKQVPTVVLNATIEVFERMFKTYPDMVFISISGNHDFATKATLKDLPVTSQWVLSKLFPLNFKLLDDGKTAFRMNEDTVVIGVPFYDFSNDYLQKVTDSYEYLITNGYEHYKNKILLTHVTLADYAEFPGRVLSTVDEFKPFTLVLCGDIHKYGCFGHVVMTGNPLHRDFSDADSSKFEKFIHLFKTDSLPKHFKIKFDQLSPRFYSLPEGYDPKEYNVYDFDYVKTFQVIKDWNVSIDTKEKMEKIQASTSHDQIITQYWELEDVNKNTDLLNAGLDILHAINSVDYES